MVWKHEKQLSVEDIKRQIKYDKETGEVFWIERKYGRPVDREAGSQDRYGYRWIRINNHQHSLARIVWCYHYGKFPKEELDFRNGKASDIRIANLQEIPYHLYQERRRARRISSEGTKGVYRGKEGLWKVRIVKDEKVYTRGPFEQPAEAYAAHKELSQELFGEFYKPVVKRVLKEFSKEDVSNAVEEFLKNNG